MTGQVNTKEQQLDRMRLHKIALTKLDLGERQVKLIGSIAIVTSRAEVEGTNEGAPVKGTFRYTRVYQRLPSGVWKITSFEATRVPGPRDSTDPRNRQSRDCTQSDGERTAAARSLLEGSTLFQSITKEKTLLSERGLRLSGL